MKKTILALVVLGATTGIAHAQQPNVTIYGIVDAGFVKESNTSARMGSNETSRIGFRGQEDLGGGLKATFQLEQRLNLNDGTNTSSGNLLPFQDSTRNTDDVIHSRDRVQFQGAANIGLAGGFGAVRLGRIAELPTESYRMIDPFNQNGVGSSIYSLLRSETLSNTARYDSPVFNGFSAGLSYTLKADDKDTSVIVADQYLNQGYALSLKYDNGPIYLTGNYSRLADSNDSDLWNIGGAYSFGDIKVSLGYQRTSADAGILGLGENTKQKDWILGLQWKIGPGALKASYNHTKLDDLNPLIDGKVKKYALGYTYDLSRRTSVYGVIAHTSSDNAGLGYLYNSNSAIDDSVTGYQIGLNHKF